MKRIVIVSILTMFFSISLFARNYLWIYEPLGYKNKEKRTYSAKFHKISADGKNLLASVESPTGIIYAITADNKKRRVFFSTGGVILCLSDKGKITAIGKQFIGYLRQIMGFTYDEKNQVLWVSVRARSEILRLALKGDEVKEGKRIKGFKGQTAIVCDPEDGSVWIADCGVKNPEDPEKPPSWVVKLDKDGKRLLSLKGYNMLGVREQGLALTKDAVYVADSANHRIVILSKEGEIQKEVPIPYPRAVSADSEGNVWVVASTNKKGAYPGQIVKLSPEGGLLVKKENMNVLYLCAVKGGCWVAKGGPGLIFIDNEGKTSVFGCPKYAPSSWELKARITKIVFMKKR